MRLRTSFRLILFLSILPGICGAISISYSSSGSGSQSSASSNYDLNSSAELAESIALVGGSISSSGFVVGSGNNSITKTATNKEASVSSSLTSTGALRTATSSYASGISLGLEENVYAIGQSVSTISGSCGPLQADQESGVLNGVLASSHTANAQAGKVNTVQSSSISGTLGYSEGQAQSSDNVVKVTSGLNGAGIIQGIMATTATDSASTSVSIKAESQESKVYSAVKSTSDDGDVYSYLSSNRQLTSSISARANGHVTTDQNLNAKGDVRVYASSTSEDSSSTIYDAQGEDISGKMSASAGSPAVVETNLEGDILGTKGGSIPTPGSWIWNGFGGYLASNQYQLTAGGKSHIFAKGGDNGLWDNVDGDWQGLGGVIASDPYAAQDNAGNIHVLVKGADGALWDKVLDGNWKGLGGYITSNPSAALDPVDKRLLAVVKGGDNAVWLKDVTNGEWSTLGGTITSNPQVIYDYRGKMHTLARGGDGALWDNVEGTWVNRGGYITSDAKPVINPFQPDFIYTSVRGADGTLWSNALNVDSNEATWRGLGGAISQGSGTLNKGNPAPVVDTNGIIRTFIRGNDGALWDNAYDIANGEATWYKLGGSITSDPSAVRDGNGKLQVAARGADNSLWINTLDTNQPMANWNVVQEGNLVKIAYGSGTNYPEYAAFYLDSSYFRMNYGPESGWGTSVIVFPSFWEEGANPIYQQGREKDVEPIQYSWRTEGSDLIMPFMGWISDLSVAGNIRIKPPDQNGLSAMVSVDTYGDIDLIDRPNEAFKPVMLSSMHISPTIWDAQSAYADTQLYGIPGEGWIAYPAADGEVFGLKGGTSTWKVNSPTIEIDLDRPLTVTGWVSTSTNPNDDNIGFWAASDHVIDSWQYKITAKKA